MPHRILQVTYEQSTIFAGIPDGHADPEVLFIIAQHASRALIGDIEATRELVRAAATQDPGFLSTIAILAVAELERLGHTTPADRETATLHLSDHPKTAHYIDPKFFIES